MATSAKTPPRHNIVFTLPRTSSNLLTQILNLPAQPNIHRHSSDGYIFLPPLIHRFKNDLAGKNVSTWTKQEQSGMKDAFQTAYDSLKEWIDEADQKGKGIYIKEHINWLVEPSFETCFLFGEQSTVAKDLFTITPTRNPESRSRSTNNGTCLPDSVLESLAPTILIRNPLLTIPSLLRTSIDIEEIEKALATSVEQWRWECSFYWSRALYEFYDVLSSSAFNRTTQSPGVTYPIILDADDLTNPELVRRYTKAVGLNDDLVRFEWERASEKDLEGTGKNVRRMKDTLLGSSGIVKGKTSEGLSLEGERGKWKSEFGEELAERMEGLVRETIGDYEWLKEKRFR